MLKERIVKFLSALPYDDFAKAEGLYWYCVQYHEGQTSDLYALQCELGFKPSVLSRKPSTKDSKKVYKLLVKTF